MFNSLEYLHHHHYQHHQEDHYHCHHLLNRWWRRVSLFIGKPRDSLNLATLKYFYTNHSKWLKIWVWKASEQNSCSQKVRFKKFTHRLPGLDMAHLNQISADQIARPATITLDRLNLDKIGTFSQLRRLLPISIGPLFFLGVFWLNRDVDLLRPWAQCTATRPPTSTLDCKTWFSFHI